MKTTISGDSPASGGGLRPSAPTAGAEFRPGVPASEVDRLLRAALTAVDRAERVAVVWFAEIRRRRLYRELGYSSIQAYATDALGFSRSRTYRFLSLVEDLDRLPRLKSAVAAGEIGWTKAIQVAKVATAGNEQLWLDEARRSGRRALAQKVTAERDRVRRRRAQDRARKRATVTRQASLLDTRMTESSNAQPAPSPERKTAVTLRLDPVQLARFDTLVEKIRKSRILPRDASREELVLAALEAFHASAHPATRRSPGSTDDTPPESPRRDSTSPYQIVVYRCATCGKSSIRSNAGERVLDEAAAAATSCDARVQDTARPKLPNRQTIPPSTRRVVLARDRHRCRAPGCDRTRFLEVHHVVPREAGGSNRPDNLLTLCAACHRLIHENPGGDRKGASALDWARAPIHEARTRGGTDEPQPP